MKYQPFAIWLLAIVLGIIFQNVAGFSLSYLLIWCLQVFALILIFRILGKFKLLLSVLGFLFMLGIGALRFVQHNQFIQEIPQTSEQKQLIHFEVDKILKPSEKYFKYQATPIQAKNDSFTRQKFLVYVKKTQKPLNVEDKFWTYGKVQLIPNAKNPHQFDYQKYMMVKQIALQIFTDTLVQVSHPQNFSFPHFFSEFKRTIKSEMDKKGFSKDSKIFISSLGLGDRTDLDKAWQERLSSAGVMHLFAISGLHVGIIFILLMTLFYPLLYLPRGKIIRIVISLILIWLYAWFVGFTPSVTRAAFMISFYYATVLMHKPTNIFHTLAFTAFVLLLINPNQLFDVGFQLSYSAVFFIAWLYPHFRKLFPHYRKPWKNRPYDLLSLTTTVQMGVMPISAYYFGKFSALFLLGNMVLLPFAGIMIAVSFMVILLLWFEVLPDFIVVSVNYVFSWVYQFLDWVTGFESLIFRNISWDWIQVVILLAILVWSKYMLKKFEWYKLLPIFALFFAFQLTRIYDEIQFKNKSELIVFQAYKGNVIGLRNADEMHVFWQVEDSVKTYNYTIQPYILNEKMEEVKFHKLFDSATASFFRKKKNLIKFNNATFYISTDKRDPLPNVDYVILQRGKFAYRPHFSDKTKKVIADGSNYPSVIRRLKQHSDKIFSTAENGAFIYAKKDKN